uniref:Uncharacterized protein n=1 Tax=Chromera velia CCMP2878 TaxID=1169474 RepID=A0A0G4G8X4_9ALVE|eukprot:Cvel_20719.t1-p1 / transcript=Cvel_20719.t1 / gene=Cvel_20719 / organism=Chromera_velia_CCMP2878 / gene_product=hypothetical protein / transcript_product=hypothetical protein / location=Cvel_scaffold1886:18429-20608(+) / protein_length=311 / sequence_SO=supercontig / SO=protein_coding / is_pseudo=false
MLNKALPLPHCLTTLTGKKVYVFDRVDAEAEPLETGVMDDVQRVFDQHRFEHIQNGDFILVPDASGGELYEASTLPQRGEAGLTVELHQSPSLTDSQGPQAAGASCMGVWASPSPLPVGGPSSMTTPSCLHGTVLQSQTPPMQAFGSAARSSSSSSTCVSVFTNSHTPSPTDFFACPLSPTTQASACSHPEAQSRGVSQSLQPGSGICGDVDMASGGGTFAPSPGLPLSPVSASAGNGVDMMVQQTAGRHSQTGRTVLTLFLRRIYSLSLVKPEEDAELLSQVARERAQQSVSGALEGGYTYSGVVCQGYF